MSFKSMNQKNKIILLLITLFAFIFRIYKSDFPPLLWDEAAIGYNAYSLIKTGADEYGSKLPLIFKSFGDFKPGFYIYLTAPFVADLGLTELAVRLPSIIAGTLTPIFLYFLITAFSPKYHRLGILAATILAFNPYNIHFSRGAWETNILTFELILASYLFVKQKYFISSLIFALTLYTYQGGKLITPLIVLTLFFVFRQNLKKYYLRFSLPLGIIALPIIFGLLFSHDSNRLQVFSLWSYPRPQTEINTITSESSVTNYNLFHNQYIYFARGFFERYFNHFSARFLTFEGDWQIARHNAPYIGFLLYPSLLFLIIGLFTFSKSSLNIFFLLWLLLAPLSSALTRDSVQPVRSMSFSIPLIFFVAQGIYFTISKYKNTLFYLAITVSYLLSFILYLDLYYNHFTKIKPGENLVGYKQVMEYVIPKVGLKDVTITDFYGQPYIYYLFYSKYNPSDYQRQSNLILSGLDTGKISKIDNIKFTSPDFSQIRNKQNQLAVFSYDEVVRQNIDTSLLTKVSPIFYIYEN